MSSLASDSPFDVARLSFDDNTMRLELRDGRSVDTPLWHFPRLYDATPEQRRKAEITPFGLHWEEIDEDISIEGLLAGRMDNTRQGRARRAEIEAAMKAAE